MEWQASVGWSSSGLPSAGAGQQAEFKYVKPTPMMKFNQQSCSESVELSASGLTAKCKGGVPAVARANVSFTEGVHYWEVICPVKCTSIDIGVAQKWKMKKSEEIQKTNVTQAFRTSTPRVIGVELDLNRLRLRFWIAGKPLEEMSKPITASKAWIPIICFREADVEVILNPLCISSEAEFAKDILPRSIKDLHDCSQLGGQATFPACLTDPISDLRKAVVSSCLDKYILVFNIDFAAKLKSEEEPNKPLDKDAVWKLIFPSDDKCPPNCNVQVSKTEIEAKENPGKQFAILKYDEARLIYGALKSLTYNHPDAKIMHCDILANLIVGAPVPMCKESGPEFAKFLLSQLGEESLNLIKEYSPEQGEPISVTELLEKEFQEPEAKAEASGDVKIKHLSYSDKMLITQGSQLKIASKGRKQSHFNKDLAQSNRAVLWDIKDEIELFFSSEQLRTILTSLRWDSIKGPEVNRFFKAVADSYDGKKLRVCFLDALISIKIFMRMAATQYQEIESRGRKLEAKELVFSEEEKSDAETPEPILSLIEASQLLNALVLIEDQLFILIFCSHKVSLRLYNVIYERELSRPHTAFGRLFSLMTLPAQSKASLTDLAESGVCNVMDTYPSQGLRFFQNSNIELEGLYGNTQMEGLNQVEGYLDKNFPSSLMLKGFPSWNVPLANSLNAMPPVKHVDPLTMAPETVENLIIKQSQQSAMILSAANSSVTLWGTEVGLAKLGSFNLKAQAKINPKGKLSRAKLHFLSYHETKTAGGATIYSVSKQKLNSASMEEGDVMRALYDEDEADLETKSQGKVITVLHDELIDRLSEESSEEGDLLPAMDKQATQKIQSPKLVIKWDSEKKTSSKEKAKEDVMSQDDKSFKSDSSEKVEANREFLKQLVDMGFSEDLSNQALVKVKNESITAAVEIVVGLTDQKIMAEREVSAVEERLTVFEWSCQQCTIQNQPGGTVCSMCGSSAPESAFENLEAKKLEEEEKARLEREEEERKVKEEQERKEAEELKEKQRLENVEKEFKATQDFLEQATLEGYVFSSVKGALKTPALFGGLMHHKQEKVADLHLKAVNYLDSYLQKFYSQNKTTGLFENKLTRVVYETEAACIASIVENNSQMLQSIFPAQNRQDSVQASEVAVVRLPLSEVKTITQLGDHLTSSAPLQIMVSGTNREGEHATFLVCVEINEKGRFLVTADASKEEIFPGVPNEDVQDVLFCGETNQLIAKAESKFHIFSKDRSQQLEEMAIEGGISDYSVEKAILLVKTATGTILKHPLKKAETSPAEPLAETKPSEVPQSINPEKLSIEDIEKFSSLLKGKAVAATSNADSVKGQVDDTTFRRHFWKSDSQPWQLNFDQKISLISLNIDLTFSSREKRTPKVRTVSNASETPKAEQVGSVNLGKFSLAPQKQSKATEIPDTSSLVPLIVHKHKGAQFNSSHQVNTIVLDNSQVFAGNYARPEFYFKHLHGHTISVEKFTIRSQISSRCGAYPVGRGLIFLADSISDFELTRPFHKFSGEDYQKWKTKRMQDPRPLRAFEPVAFFEFDEKTSLSVSLDFKRKCKYIMLKPTGFRTKPHLFRQNMNDLPMEMEFFGVHGVATPQEEESSLVPENRPGQVEIETGYSLQVMDSSSGEEILSIDDLGLSQLSVNSVGIDASKVVSTDGFVGHLPLRLTDKALSERSLSGLTIVVKSKENLGWALKGAAVEGFVTETSAAPPQFRVDLIHPENFSKVNGPLAKMLCAKETNPELAAMIMNFLAKLMKADNSFVPLVMETLDLEAFIEVNLLTSDQAHIEDSTEFLTCFQHSPVFTQRLYDLMSKFLLEELPKRMPVAQGYEALIGLLNWVLPMDMQNSLRVLLKALYSEITLKCIPKVQTPEFIQFRTRAPIVVSESSVNSSMFPFDETVMGCISKFQKTAKNPKQNGAKQGLIRDFTVTAVKKSMKHTYKLVFSSAKELTRLQLYFAENQGALFKFVVLITSGNEIVHHSTHNESTFARLTKYKRSGAMSKDLFPAEQDDSLTLPLNVTCSELELVIIYSPPTSQLSSKSAKDQAPMPQLVIPEAYSASSEDLLPSLKDKPSGSQKFIGSSITVVEVPTSSQNTVTFVPVWEDAPPTPTSAHDSPLTTGEQADQSEEQSQADIQGQLELMRLLQTNLREIISQSNGFKSNIIGHQITLRQIRDLQAAICQKTERGYISDGAHSLQYFTTLAVDLANLITSLFEKGSFTEAEVRAILKDLEPDSSSPLVDLSEQIFTRFVIYERTVTRSRLLAVFKDRIWTVLEPEEKSEFFTRILKKFLAKPESGFSQKNVVDALEVLDFQTGELIKFANQTFEGENKQSPMVMLTSILSLCLRHFQRHQQDQKPDLKPKQTGTLKKGGHNKKKHQDSAMSPPESGEGSDGSLEPLDVQRSYSVPINRPKLKPPVFSQDGSLSFEDQLLALFRLTVWISRQPASVLTTKQQVALLSQAVSNLNCLTQLIPSLSPILQIVQMGSGDLLELCVSILSLADQKLLKHLQTFLESFATPVIVDRLASFVKQAEEKKVANTAEVKEARHFLADEKTKHKEILRHWIQQTQRLLVWLVERQRSNSEQALFTRRAGSTASGWASELSKKCQTSLQVWIEHLSFLLDGYIADTKALMALDSESSKQPKGDNQQVNDDFEDEEDLVPLKVAKSLSLPIAKQPHQGMRVSPTEASISLIKCLMSLLDNDPPKGNAFIPQIWSLVLRSFTTVSVSKLVEAKIFDTLIKAFLKANIEIQQSIIPKILQISEKIAQDKAHSKDAGKLLSNLVFTTLGATTNQPALEPVGFSACQGWLDIMIHSSVSQTSENMDKVFVRMEPAEACLLLKKTVHFMKTHLNMGSFEGPTGAQKAVVMRLNLACDLLHIAFKTRVRDSEERAIVELEKLITTDSKIEKDFSEAIDDMICWLFLNARGSAEEQAHNPLGNVVNQTPSTSKVKRMTDMLETFLMSLGHIKEGERVVEIALKSLIKVVKQMNTSLRAASSERTMGADALLNLSRRTNDYFTKFVAQWLKSDQIASHFVFDLGGFEFLLDTIGSRDEEPAATEKEAEKSEEGDTDLFDSGESSIEPFFEDNIVPVEQLLGVKLVQSLDKKLEINSEEPLALQLCELANKNLQLVHDNSGTHSSSMAKIDWSCNKRAYKNRLLVTGLTNTLKNEYKLLFKLQQTSLVREIQIGFTNYWSTDAEVYSEPLSVLVSAGLDKNSLTTVCSLDLVKDDGFGSVQATVFGKNLHSYRISMEEGSKNVGEQIEQIIADKLASLGNFEANYIEISLRRHVLSCLENSPLASRQSKRPAFAINYISLLGYKLTAPGELGQRAHTFIASEQKKTALEVLSRICSGNFSTVLRVISNQEKTIQKIKSQFDLLSSLVSIKSSLIEPTFIAIAKYNKEMGDWMISKFLQSPDFERHAALTANLVMCERSEVANRLQMLQDHLMTFLQEKELKAQAMNQLLPAIQVFVQSVRLCAPGLTSYKSIDLAVEEETLINILDSTAAQEWSTLQYPTRMLYQFVVLLLYPPAPFVNSKASPKEFVQRVLDIEETESTDKAQKNRRWHRQTLASVLAASSSEIADSILKKQILIKQLTEPASPLQGQDLDELEHALAFWNSVSQDSDVRAHLQEQRLPFTLYQLLRSNAGLSTSATVQIVDLIKLLMAGHEQLEGELADLLIEDLEKLSKDRDMNFVNRVFIPLIKVERTLPLTLTLGTSKSTTEQAIDQDPLLPTDISSIAEDEEAGDPTFMATSLLEQKQKEYLKMAFNQIVGGKTSKANSDKMLSGKWSRIHEWKKSSGETPEHLQDLGFWRQLEGRGPCVVITKGWVTNEGGQDTMAVFGAFWQGKVPAVPASENFEPGPELAHDVEAKEGDFCFCYLPNGHFHYTSAEDFSLAQIAVEYEGGVGLAIGGSFMLLSYCQSFENCFGYLDEVDEVQVEGVPVPSKTLAVPEELNIVSTEVWALDGPESMGSAAKSVESELDQTRLTSLSMEHKHPWVVPNCPFNLFRPNPVYMVPAHLDIKTVVAILLKREGEAGVTTLFPTAGPVADLTVEQVFQQFFENIDRAEELNRILDLKFDRQKVLKNTTEIDALKKSEDGDQLMEQISAQYAPQMSFFAQFEGKGGVTKIIQVTLSSLTLWKCQSLADRWRLWLQELHSFSQIPMFFQIFLKHQKSKELLFKVLAGLPDSEISADSNKKAHWENEQKEAVLINYKILGEVFSVSSDVELREKALSCGLLPRILERLSAISGEKPRTVCEEEDSEEEIIEQEAKEEEKPKEDKPMTKRQEIEAIQIKKKKKGVGYSSKQGQAFDVNAYLENTKQRNDQIRTLVDICSNFIGSSKWQATEEVATILIESALLPLLEQAFRNGSWLDMVQAAEVYQSYLALTRALASQPKLVSCLLPIGNGYKPLQKDAVHKLLAKLNDLAEIFLKCLKQQPKDGSDEAERPERLAKDVISTSAVVKEALEQHKRDEGGGESIESALSLPLVEKYRALLSHLRFDYMSMRDPNIKGPSNGTHDYQHHYKSVASQNESPPASKMIRLAQELADLSNALPCEHTNSIFVRVDKQRVDMMKALIVGSTNTPYAHGCYEFDIFCDNKYPNESPKMNLMTTGNGTVRFNPNLYACGKVCLSLLGTWRGSATENWDPKLSTILQVLVSVQAIIMSEDVYFNEPGFENEAGTVEGEKKNEGYSNIVRFANVKFAMLGQLKNPPKGFESVIKRHFYVKKEEVLKEVNRWVELAQKNEAMYTGLVHDHNYTWCSQFKLSKTKYREMLEEVVRQLEDALHKLDRPTDISNAIKAEQKHQAVRTKKIESIREGQANLEDIDVDDDNQIDSTVKKKQLNVDDEAVKDRWSRYIGAMGVEAVAKQASANIFLSGAGALGIEIAKNIVLSGCKSFTLHDPMTASLLDLSGQFFINEDTDLAKPTSRASACLQRLQQLNLYVRCHRAPDSVIPLDDEKALEEDPWNMSSFNVIILTECDSKTIRAVNAFCRKRDIKLIVADCRGVFSRVFNDFTANFEVLDKNGEELQDVLVQSISSEEKGIVELLKGQAHKLEDGDEVLISEVEGMHLKEGQTNDDPEVKSSSINQTIHKVQVITPSRFKIGNTAKYEPHVKGGVIKQLKTKVQLKFKTFEDATVGPDLPLDPNMAIADFEKMDHATVSHLAFLALDAFQISHSRLPKPWDQKDTAEFIEIAQKEAEKAKIDFPEKESKGLKLLHLFVLTCQGVFSPLCAFVGGYVAQECVKAITQKFTPTHQLFYYDAVEVAAAFKVGEVTEQQVSERAPKGDRYDGLRIIVGQPIIEKLSRTNLFMVGAGAIGCELLKNYAMLGIGCGDKDPNDEKSKPGSIVLTDPDVIEVSNLNRQFLFREKHLRKPKSSTAAAAAIQMNKNLKGHIISRLDKVHDGTNHIFTDSFFESLTIVTNALDNLAARKYVDQRCVTAKTPLLESGTLGPKGHVQVILPFKTESYSSQKDPEDNNEIPHCTLKMFPEETLHCVEWARDLFGKLFSQAPKSAAKILEEGKSVNPISSQDVLAFKEGLSFLEDRPASFSDCVSFARKQFDKYFHHDIRQLLHVYPLDAQTKEGNLFWSLPKRPPQPAVFDEKNALHQQVVSALACLRATVFKITIPSDKPRSDEFRAEVAKQAADHKMIEFVPDESASKEIQDSVDKNGKENDEEEAKQEEAEAVVVDDVEALKKKFIALWEGIKDPASLVAAEEFEKDNDANFHIDFMHAMGNCRAHCYKLDPMDWIQVKLKAGRIVPAMATTTASIAGLQALELVKYLCGVKKEDQRNAFLNLAVPIMQASEPGDVQKLKITEALETTLWDRWELEGKDKNLKEIIAAFEEKYKELEVRDILKGNTPLYFHSIMVAKSEKERETTLQSKLVDLAEVHPDDLDLTADGKSYMDLTITCVAKGGDTILEGVPPVRVFL